jgi:hypothetical protein
VEQLSVELFQDSKMEFENLSGTSCSSEFLETFALLCQFQPCCIQQSENLVGS